MSKKKILHLITGLEIGGAEMMLLKTLPHLQENFDNHVCCIRGHGPIGEKLEDAGIVVSYLNFRSVLDLGIILRFREVVRDFCPDILTTHLIHADLFGRIFGKIFGIKTITCYQHGQLLQWEFLRIVDRLTKLLVTKYIVQTKTARQELMKTLRLPKKRFAIIPNTIDTGDFTFDIDRDKKREEFWLLPSDIVITCVSNLRRGKGHEFLLEAFESLSLRESEATAAIQSPRIKLLIVGDGEQRGKLLMQAENYKSKSDILFLGNRTDVKEILKISDIFVLPTLGEGMSIAIMEAMASGLPIITTDIPENQELIADGATGTLVQTRSPLALMRAIEKMISDKQRRLVLGANAKSKIRKCFNIDIVVSKLTQLFDAL